MKTRPAYYSVAAVRDGTIWWALPSRKPVRHGRGRSPVIDDEGIYEWDIDPAGRAPAGLSDWQHDLRFACIATSLNTRRVIRLQVESRLDDLSQRLASIEAQLQHIEQQFDCRTRGD